MTEFIIGRKAVVWQSHLEHCSAPLIMLELSSRTCRLFVSCFAPSHMTRNSTRWRLHYAALLVLSLGLCVLFVREPGFGDDFGYWSLAFNLHEIGPVPGASIILTTSAGLFGRELALAKLLRARPALLLLHAHFVSLRSGGARLHLWPARNGIAIRGLDLRDRPAVRAVAGLGRQPADAGSVRNCF